MKDSYLTQFISDFQYLWGQVSKTLVIQIGNEDQLFLLTSLGFIPIV
jgi:hypothetical protein